MKVLQEEIEKLQDIILEFKTKFNFDTFKSLKTTKEKFEYLTINLPYLGHGTSRIVFLLPNTGYVLKFAKNSVGLKQNEAEAEVYTNPKIKDLVAKIRDAAPDYSWIVSQTVKPFKTPEEFSQATGVTPKEVYNYFYVKKLAPESKEKLGQNKFIQRIQKLIDTTDLNVGDLIAYDHYGKTSDGRLALLDYGYTNAIDNSNLRGEFDLFPGIK